MICPLTSKFFRFFDKLGIHKTKTCDYNADVSPFNKTLTWSLRHPAEALFLWAAGNPYRKKAGAPLLNA